MQLRDDTNVAVALSTSMMEQDGDVLLPFQQTVTESRVYRYAPHAKPDNKDKGQSLLQFNAAGVLGISPPSGSSASSGGPPSVGPVTMSQRVTVSTTTKKTTVMTERADNSDNMKE